MRSWECESEPISVNRALGRGGERHGTNLLQETRPAGTNYRLEPGPDSKTSNVNAGREYDSIRSVTLTYIDRKSRTN